MEEKICKISSKEEFKNISLQGMDFMFTLDVIKDCIKMHDAISSLYSIIREVKHQQEVNDNLHYDRIITSETCCHVIEELEDAKFLLEHDLEETFNSIGHEYLKAYIERYGEAKQE